MQQMIYYEAFAIDENIIDIILSFLDKHAIYCSGIYHLNQTWYNVSRHYLNPSLNDQQLLRRACFMNNMSKVKLLLRDNRVDPSIHGQILLRNACTFNRPELVRILLQDERVDPSVNDNECIVTVCSQGYLAIFHMLFNHEKVNITAQKFATVKFAARNGWTEILRLLLTKRSVTDKINEWFEDAKFGALLNRHTKVVELLDNVRKI